MINSTDLDALRASFRTWDKPGLPGSLATDCARLLEVTDITISFYGASDQLMLCASSSDARNLDEWEFTLQEGPCFDAAATSASSTAETAPSRTNPWPRLSAKALAIGYQSIGGVPLRMKGTTFATLNLQNRNGPITPETLADAEYVADQLASLVVGSLSQQPHSLDQPADHDSFHQATGMVMEQMGIDAAAAIELLRGHAWSQNRLLIDVGSDVVNRTLAFPQTQKT